MTEKKSKVALCKGCKGMVMAAHIDHISKVSEKEFTELTNENFEVKIETLEKTKSRKFVLYSPKENGKCKDCNQQK